MTNIINGMLVLFSAVFIGLGVMGYLHVDANGHHSVISLIAGGITGALMLASLFVWTKNPRAGRIFGVVVSVLGMYQPVSNIIKGKFTLYPSGVLLATALLAFVALGAGHMMATKAKKATAE